MRSTLFANPHGLADKGNHSTAYELAIISSHLLKMPLLRKIVNTKAHYGTTYLTAKQFEKYFRIAEFDFFSGSEVPFHSEPGQKFYKYKTNWQNSNRLLTNDGFSGIKTGIT